MRRQDGLGLSAADEQRNHGARQVLQESDAGRRRVVGDALSEGELGTAISTLCRGGSPLAGSSGFSTLSHLDVCGRIGARRILNDVFAEAVGHVY